VTSRTDGGSSGFLLRQGKQCPAIDGLLDQVGGSLQWDMTSCLDGAAFLLFYDPVESRKNSYDKWEGDQPDGSFWYVGQGRSGDQSLTKSNLGLVNASDSVRPIHFFRRPAIGSPRAKGNPYQYVGQVSLGAPQYSERMAPGMDRREGMVIVFKLMSSREMSFT